MNKRSTIALLLTSTCGYLVSGTNGHSLLSLHSQLSVDPVDKTNQDEDAVVQALIDQPQTDLEQSLNETPQQPKQQPKIKNKPIKQKTVKKIKEVHEPLDKFRRTGLIGNDNISAASTEEMYAFSQVLASGGSVNKAVKILEQEAKQEKQKETDKEKEEFELSLKAMREANKSEEEKQLDKQREKLNKLARKELDTIQSNEQTAALASLVDAQKLEIMAEQMQGSGIDLEEQKKQKAKAAQKKHNEELKKRQLKKQSLVQQKIEAKKKVLERKQKIEQAFQKLQSEHGGLNGTEDTGYDDSAMDAYVARPEPGQSAEVMIQQDDIRVEEYEALLVEHRNHVLTKKMTEDA